MKICYIAHPISGNIEANLASIRYIVHRINTDPKFSHVVPFVPYYADVVSCDDNIPAQRERGLNNDINILGRRGMVDEVWLFGPRISEGMKQEITTALSMRIPVIAKSNSLFESLKEFASSISVDYKIISEEWEKE